MTPRDDMGMECEARAAAILPAPPLAATAAPPPTFASSLPLRAALCLPVPSRHQQAAEAFDQAEACDQAQLAAALSASAADLPSTMEWEAPTYFYYLLLATYFCGGSS